MEGPGYYYQVKYIVPYYCLIERLLRDSGCFCSSSRSLRVLILTCCGWYFSSGSILALYAAISPAVLFLEPNLRILGHFSLFSSRIINYITAISLLIQCSMFWHVLFFEEVDGFVNSPRITFLSNLPGITYQSLFQNVFIKFVIFEMKIKQEVDLVFFLTGLSVVSPV